MSAVRRNDRRTTRNSLASPYARPAKSNTTSNPSQKKKSLWSFTGLLSYLNPLRFGSNGASSGRTERDRSESPSSDDEVRAQADTDDGHPSLFRPQLPEHPGNPDLVLGLPFGPQDNHLLPIPANDPIPELQNSAPQTPARQSLPFPLGTPSPQNATAPHTPQSASIARNLEPVTRFLAEKAGQPLNEFEAAGIVDYIQKNMQNTEKPEPFRFSSSTPSRDPSPNTGVGSSNVQGNGASSQTPRKTLSRNPNGVYRWQGAASARPRTRYQSPGFGQRPQQPRMKLSPPPTPQSDTKRRRLGEDAGSSTSQKVPVSSPAKPRIPVTSPSPHPPAQSAREPNIDSKPAPAPPVTPKSNGVSAPRFRTPGLSAKPTAPAIPSPLRQAWKQNDSPPQTMAPTYSRPTKAANFMTELIKEVTPPKKADVSNPYQTASPVKPPQKKPSARKPRSTRRDKEKAQEKEKLPEMTAQAIIEATVPKGSKRSRPPPEMESSSTSETSKKPNSSIPSLPSVNGARETSKVERTDGTNGATDDDDESPTKKRKTAQTSGSTRTVVEIEEVQDDDAPMNGYTRPSEVIEPDEEPALPSSRPSARTSPAPIPAVSKPSVYGAKRSVPREPSKLRYSVQIDKVEGPTANPPVPPSPRPAPAALPTEGTAPKPTSNPKDAVLAMDTNSLPKYSFAFPEQPSYPAGPSHIHARKLAGSTPLSALPTFTFTDSKPASSTNGFNWTAAGAKPPTAVGGNWMCDTCMLTNPDDAKEKCTICEAPRPGATPAASKSPAAAPSSVNPPSAPIQAFDWGAAGIKPPKSASGSWTCSTCMLSNPATATEKCTICDTPR